MVSCEGIRHSAARSDGRVTRPRPSRNASTVPDGPAHAPACLGLAKPLGLADELDRPRRVSCAALVTASLGERLQDDHAWRMLNGRAAARPAQHIDRLAVENGDMHVGGPAKRPLERLDELGLQCRHGLTGGGEPAEAGDVHSAGLVNDVFAGEIHTRKDRVDLRRYLARERHRPAQCQTLSKKVILSRSPKTNAFPAAGRASITGAGSVPAAAPESPSLGAAILFVVRSIRSGAVRFEVPSRRDHADESVSTIGATRPRSIRAAPMPPRTSVATASAPIAKIAGRGRRSARSMPEVWEWQDMRARSLDGDGLGQVARLIDVGALQHG